MENWKHFKAQAIIFDKDGTLIDFDAMWGGWALYLSEQLEQVSGLQVREKLCVAMGYDEANKKVLAHGKLAATPMHLLYRLTVEVMQSLGLSAEEAERVTAEGWYIPDPIILAKPFTDTRALFEKIHARGIKIAIATTDDRAPTQAMLEAFDIEEYLETMVCADDGIPAKPAPDMVYAICERMKIHPSKVMVVGDTTADLKMARAAGAGLVVGVLSGVSNAKDISPYADILVDSVDHLHHYADLLTEWESARGLSGFQPDIALD